MSLLTPSQSVSQKWFHQCVNHKKKQNLRHPLPTFGSFSFFQASLWLRVDKVLQKLTKSYESEFRHLFQCCILIPRKCPCKTQFQHKVPPLATSLRSLHIFYNFWLEISKIDRCGSSGFCAMMRINFPLLASLLYCAVLQCANVPDEKPRDTCPNHSIEY